MIWLDLLIYLLIYLLNLLENNYNKVIFKKHKPNLVNWVKARSTFYYCFLSLRAVFIAKSWTFSHATYIMFKFTYKNVNYRLKLLFPLPPSEICKIFLIFAIFWLVNQKFWKDTYISLTFQRCLDYFLNSSLVVWEICLWSLRNVPTYIRMYCTRKWAWKL